MTFAIVQTERSELKVIGHVLALDEAQAKSMMSQISVNSIGNVSIKKTEERELPLKLQAHRA